MIYCNRYYILFFFYVAFLNSMDKIETTASQECFILGKAERCVNQAIIQSLSYQSISRLKQASPQCNNLYDSQQIHHTYDTFDCLSSACTYFAQNYYACDKALGHYARLKNQKMVNHLCRYDTTVRNLNWSLSEKFSTPLLYYGNCYSSTALAQEHMIRSLYAILIDNGVKYKKNIIDTMLAGSGFNVFDVLCRTEKNSKKNREVICDMIVQVTILNEPEVMKMFCAGFVRPFLIKWIMKLVSVDIITILIKSLSLN